MEKMRGSANRLVAGAVMTGAALMLAACGGGGGGGGSVPQGTVSMSLTDEPACYKNVYVTVTRVMLHKAGTAEGEGAGGWEEITPPKGPVKVDLLNLTNGKLEDLGMAEVDAVSYDQVRLVLAENSGVPYANYVTLLSGTDQELKTPSAAQSGLKIKADFAVAAGGTTDLLLDFDACKSIVIAGNSGQYILKPVVRLSGKPVGSIAGAVTTTMTLSATTISAQQNGQVLRSTTPDKDGLFKLAYLEPGTYTVVITSADRATGVISSVPVGTTTTTVNGTATIVLPTSPMGTVTGVVKAGTALVTDAMIIATQDVAAGGPVQVLSRPVDFELATYTMQLPTADAVRAPYAAGVLTFNADTTAAGKYKLTSTSPTKGTLTQTITPPATVNFTY